MKTLLVFWGWGYERRDAYIYGGGGDIYSCIDLDVCTFFLKSLGDANIF